MYPNINLKYNEDDIEAYMVKLDKVRNMLRPVVKSGKFLARLAVTTINNLQNSGETRQRLQDKRMTVEIHSV